MTTSAMQLCLVVGTPRGFTRSVLESLLKRGNRVILACNDSTIGEMEQERLSSLYGRNKVHFTPGDHTCPKNLESVFVKALDTFGEVNLIVNSTANDPQRLSLEELSETRDLRGLEKRLDLRQQEEDVEGIRRLGRLAVKYMGKQNGFQGGNLLNLTSAVELSCSAGAGTCTVLGTTRALGMHNRAKEHGPTIDYPDLSQAAQITDDSHSPHYKWDRYSAYVRDYTGLEEVQPESISSSCGITNKMCFWMGCPMVKEADIEEVQREEREVETNCANNLESLVETQEMD